MYTFGSRVRFSEIDHSKKLTLSSLVNYFQDCSTFQSEDLGLGIEVLKEKGKVWILSSWQIIVERYPEIGENIQVSTWATGFEGLYATRNFQMVDESGERVAYANSVWVLMDIKKGRPLRPMPEDVAAYEQADPIRTDFASRKIALPKETEDRADFPVLRAQIDTNEHVNNCQYIQMAAEIMPECARSGQIRVEYKKSAVFGDRIYPKTAAEADRKVVELCGADGKPFAVVEFKEK